MNARPFSKTTPHHAPAFTASWTEELGAAIAAAAPKRGYLMSLVGEDGHCVVAAVNQGIDAHLEACFVPDRGDSFTFQTAGGIHRDFAVARLECSVSPQSLVILVRRLMESGNAAAESLAANICASLGIELI